RGAAAEGRRSRQAWAADREGGPGLNVSGGQDLLFLFPELAAEPPRRHQQDDDADRDRDREWREGRGDSLIVLAELVPGVREREVPGDGARERGQDEQDVADLRDPGRKRDVGADDRQQAPN